MKSFGLALAIAAPAQAALRFGCSTLSIQRLDPIVEPGAVPSAHLHQIVGGNAFNATMDGDVGERGSCTTCTFSEDFSNYWTAVLFFKHANSTYKRVPIMQNTALPNGINGGMTVYYTQQDFSSNGNQKITSFKPVCGGPPSLASYGRRVLLGEEANVALGLPDDGRQPLDDHAGRRKGPRRPPVRVPRQQGHALPRASRLPDEALQGWHHDRPPLRFVSRTLLPAIWTVTADVLVKMLGRQDPRHPQPPGPHVQHRRRGLRRRPRVPGEPPRQDGAGSLRNALGHYWLVLLHGSPCAWVVMFWNDD